MVTLGGSGHRPDRSPRARRALAPLRAIVSRVAAARMRRRLRAEGLHVEQLDTGDRSRRHRWGLGVRYGDADTCRRARSWRHRGSRPSSVVERALADAARVLGAPPRVRDAGVLPSGIVLVELDGARPSMLRVAAGPARALLAEAQGKLASLAAADPPANVRERIAWTVVAEDDLGLAAYTLEPRLQGRHPRRLSPALWEECLDFLTALRKLPGARRPAAGSLADDIRTLAPHVGPDGGGTLVRLEAALDERLAGVPLGWAHGDFWRRNLLARGDRLIGVLDWDAASPGALPLLDLLHLIALADPHLRRLPHGERCRSALWPFARSGGDARLRSHCEAVGVPDDPATLEALAIAYWLTRVARDLRTFADRPARSVWMESNLHRPLTALASWA